MNSFVRDDKTLRKETRRLIKNISRRIERIEKYDKITITVVIKGIGIQVF